MTTQWTPEQQKILDSKARILLVRAGPGSGKTRVFVERTLKHLKDWPHEHGGIAALSFTNVASEEIARRMGGKLPAPHFVGTLDSFMFRFVVGPFGHLAGVNAKGARLIPSPLNEQITKPYIDISPSGGKPFPVPIFVMDACDGDESHPSFLFKPSFGNTKMRSLDEQHSSDALQRKQREWANNARITHSDSNLLAATIFNGPHGDQVCALLGRRFPVILIDEFQDTGHFLGRAILSLLKTPALSAILVGDQDQRIYGFTGADPKLFSKTKKISGCTDLPMRVSHRCNSPVAKIASALSRSKSKVLPVTGAPTGAAVLFIHDGGTSDDQLALRREADKQCHQHRCKSLCVLVRTNEEKRPLQGQEVEPGIPLAGKGPRQLDKATRFLQGSQGDKAARVIESLLGHLLIETRSPSRADLIESAIDPLRFKSDARRIVLEATQHPVDETWGQWRNRMKSHLKEVAAHYEAAGVGVRLGGMFRSNKTDKLDEKRQPPKLAKRNPDIDTTFRNTHEAKGLEFDGVLVFCRKPRKNRCPSETWWASPSDGEEREVAFVAASRARRLVMIALHSKTYEAMKKVRPDFLALFDSTIDLCPRPKKKEAMPGRPPKR